jgi:lipopolysaccharide exporter
VPREQELDQWLAGQTDNTQQTLSSGQPGMPLPGRRSFIGDVLKIVGGTSIAQLLIALATPLLTRLYLPEHFGTANVFISLISVAGIAVCLRYEVAVLLPDRDEDGANLLGLALPLAGIVSALVLGMLAWGGETLTGWLNAPELQPQLLLVPAALVAMGFYQALNFWNMRRRKFWRLAAARLVMTGAQLATQFAAAWLLRAEAGGLILGTTLGYGVAALVLLAITWRDDRVLFRQAVHMREMLENLVRYRKFPLVDAWAIMIEALSWQVPVWLLSAYFSQTVVGYYGMAYRLVQLPIAFIGAAFSQVFMQRAVEFRKDPQQLQATVGSVFSKLVALSLFPAVLLSLAGREMFIVFLGANWAEAGVYVQIMGMWTFFWFLSGTLRTLTATLERQELAFLFHGVTLLTRAAAFLAGCLLQDVYLALWLSVGTGILVYGWISLTCLHLAGYPLRRAWQVIGSKALWAIPAGIVLGGARLVNDMPPWGIIVLAALLFGIYLWFVLRKELLK